MLGLGSEELRLAADLGFVSSAPPVTWFSGCVFSRCSLKSGSVIWAFPGSYLNLFEFQQLPTDVLRRNRPRFPNSTVFQIYFRRWNESPFQEDSSELFSQLQKYLLLVLPTYTRGSHLKRCSFANNHFIIVTHKWKNKLLAPFQKTYSHIAQKQADK